MTNTVFSSVVFDDAFSAMAWLSDVFGFQSGLVVPGPDKTIAHAEMWLGDGVIQIGSRASARDGRDVFSTGPALTYLRVDDVQVAAEAAERAGAVIVQPVMDGPSGPNFIAQDGEGNLWAVGDYLPRKS